MGPSIRREGAADSACPERLPRRGGICGRHRPVRLQPRVGRLAGQRARAVRPDVPDDPERGARPARPWECGLRGHLLAIAVVPADPRDPSGGGWLAASRQRCPDGPQRRDRSAVGRRHSILATARVRRSGAAGCNLPDRPADRPRAGRGRRSRVRRNQATAAAADRPAHQVTRAASGSGRRIRRLRRDRAAADRRPGGGLPGGR